MDLYETALKYDSNKIKIFDRLIKDTIYYNNKNSKNKTKKNVNSTIKKTTLK